MSSGNLLRVRGGMTRDEANQVWLFHKYTCPNRFPSQSFPGKENQTPQAGFGGLIFTCRMESKMACDCKCSYMRNFKTRIEKLLNA